MRRIKSFALVVVKYLEYANSLLLLMAVLVIAKLMVFVRWQVIIKYFFNGTTTWVFEIAEYGMVFVIFTPLARAKQIGQHIRLDGIVTQLSQKTNTKLNVVT